MLIREVRQGQHGRENAHPRIFSLKELDIEPHLSSRAQRIAAVPEDKFERALESGDHT
jgi:hypothetical protein